MAFEESSGSFPEALSFWTESSYFRNEETVVSLEYCQISLLLNDFRSVIVGRSGIFY